jgi:hypothetical protein
LTGKVQFAGYLVRYGSRFAPRIVAEAAGRIGVYPSSSICKATRHKQLKNKRLELFQNEAKGQRPVRGHFRGTNGKCLAHGLNLVGPSRHWNCIQCI